jgi:hypothetical protein
VTSKNINTRSNQKRSINIVFKNRSSNNNMVYIGKTQSKLSINKNIIEKEIKQQLIIGAGINSINYCNSIDTKKR